MADDKRVCNSRYQEWVRAGLALRYLREGILQLVDQTVKRQHQEMLSEIYRQFGSTVCSNCSLKTLLPVHSKGARGCPFLQKNCNCLSPNQRKLCPTMFCSAMYDKILAQHRFGAPNWKNTDIQHWHENHWEIAKCNMSDGYSSKQSAQDTDCSGLLLVIVNDMEMQSVLDQTVDPPNDIFSKVRKARDTVFHSADQELDEATTKAYIDDMISILNDQKYLVNLEDAKKATQKLVQLKENKLVITSQDELDMRKEALEDIEKLRQETLEVIESRQDKAIALLQIYEQNAIKQKVHEQQTRDRLKEEMDKFFQQTKATTDSTELKLKEIERKQSLLEAAVDSQRESQEKITNSLTELKLEISTLKQTGQLESCHKQRIGGLEQSQKIDVQKILVEIYEENYTKTSVVPMLPEEQVDVTDIYAELTMVPDGKYQLITSYEDLFFTDKRKNFKIYLTGDAGMGKSTFCKHLIKKWCAVHTDEGGTDNLLNIEQRDVEVLKNFQFLFFVSLKHEKEHLKIEDMIKHQIFEDEDEGVLGLVHELLLKESEKCLIILDGLDEWNPEFEDFHAFKPFTNTNLPQIPTRSKCTVLTTSRPWKMNSALLRPTDVDLHVKLQGIDSTNFHTVVLRVTTYLNQKYQRTKDFREFTEEVYQDKRLTELRLTPFMLLQYICLWHDGKPLRHSLCDTYSDMTELFLQSCQVKASKPKSLLEHWKETVTLFLQPHQKNTRTGMLPSFMNSKTMCQKYKDLLFVLSKLSFESLFTCDGQTLINFDRDFAQKAGLEMEDIDLCLRIGILTENKIVGKSAVKRLSSLSFVHKTFQEFFSALFLYSCTKSEKMDESPSTKVKSKQRIKHSGTVVKSQERKEGQSMEMDQQRQEGKISVETAQQTLEGKNSVETAQQTLEGKNSVETAQQTLEGKSNIEIGQHRQEGQYSVEIGEQGQKDRSTEETVHQRLEVKNTVDTDQQNLEGQSNTEIGQQRQGGQSTVETCLQRIIFSCSTIDKILEMGNFFIFISGMNPTLAAELSKHIYNVADCDQDIQSYRSSLINDRTIVHVQKLVKDCIEEMALQNQVNLDLQMQLNDLYIDDYFNEKYLQHIDASNTKSLVNLKVNLDPESVDKLQKCRKLQKFTYKEAPLLLGGTKISKTSGNLLKIALHSKDTIESLELKDFTLQHDIPCTQSLLAVLKDMKKLRALKLQKNTLQHDDVEKMFSSFVELSKLEELSLMNLGCTEHGSDCSLELLLNSLTLQVLELHGVHFNITFLDNPNQGSSNLKKVSFGGLKATTEMDFVESLSIITSKGSKIESVYCSIGHADEKNQTPNGLLSVTALINFIQRQYCLKELVLNHINFKEEELILTSNKKLENLRFLGCPMSDRAMISIMESIGKMDHSVTVYFGKCKVLRKGPGKSIMTMIDTWKQNSKMQILHTAYDGSYFEALFQWEPGQA